MEQAVEEAASAVYILRLYVAGNSARSLKAIEDIKRICETHFKDHYDLKVVDIYQQPAMTRNDQIVAAPTLVKSDPGPERRLIGDLSNEARVLSALGAQASTGRKS